MAGVVIEPRKEGEIKVLKIKGALDVPNSEQLNTVMRESIGIGEAKIICDMSEVTYICSATIGVFYSKKEQADDAHGRIVIASPSEEVKNVFDTVNMSHVISITNTVKEAIDLY